jgi:hypothetical protein
MRLRYWDCDWDVGIRWLEGGGGWTDGFLGIGWSAFLM